METQLGNELQKINVYVVQAQECMARQKIKENIDMLLSTHGDYWKIVSVYLPDDFAYCTNNILQYLACSLAEMSKCNAAYFVAGWHKSHICRIMRDICRLQSMTIYGEPDPDEIFYDIADSTYTIDQLVHAKQEAAKAGKRMTFEASHAPQKGMATTHTVNYLNMDLPLLLREEAKKRDPVSELLHRYDHPSKGCIFEDYNHHHCPEEEHRMNVYLPSASQKKTE